MSDTDSDELSHPGRLDSEFDHPGRSSVDSTRQLGVNVCPHSVNTIQDQPPAKVGSTPSTRSAHYQGDRGGGPRTALRGRLL